MEGSSGSSLSFSGYANRSPKTSALEHQEHVGLEGLWQLVATQQGRSAAPPMTGCVHLVATHYYLVVTPAALTTSLERASSRHVSEPLCTVWMAS